MSPSFHFLRPDFLWLLLPAALVVIANMRQLDQRARWQQVIAPALLDHLLVTETSERRFRPLLLFTITAALAILALAGPAWEKEPSPFTEDQAALVIVVKVTPSMQTTDLQPDRLQRVSHKIHDLLQERAGAKTALVAYAGSAHRVMPLTRDAEVINVFAGELSPELMPLEGDNPTQALALATQILTRAGVPGSVLLVTDDLDPRIARQIRADRPSGESPPVVLAAIDTERSPAETQRMRDGSSALGADVEFITPDNADILAVNKRLESNLSAASNPDEADRWRDAGYLLTPVLALLMLAWFRPGWFLSWEA